MPSTASIHRRPTWLRPRLALAVLALFGGALAPGSARAQAPDTVMYAVNATTTLYTVQRATGATAVLTNALSYNTSAIARDPVSGRIYYTSTNYGTAAQNGRVGYYDPATATNVVVNGTGNGDNVVRLAFNQAGQLFGIGSNAPTTLYQISTTTGVMTALGPVKLGTTTGPDLGASGDLAFDYDGTLYASASVANGSTVLYRIATTPSAGVYVATAIGTITTATEASLAFGADGQLYSAGSNGTMYIVNKASGVASSTVTTGGLAYYDFATSPRFADLSVTGSTLGVPVGGTASYTITVSNSGPQSANGQVTVVDSLPNGMTYASVSGAGWSCAAVGRRVTCTTRGPVAVGVNTTFTLNATVAAGTAVGTSMPNILRVTGSTIDPDQTDNRVVVPGTAVINVILTLNKSHVGNFTVGTNGTYTITAKNTGTSPSSGTITFVDTLPAGMLLVTGTGTGFTCVTAGTAPQVITCTYPGSIGAGVTQTATLTVSVGAAAAPSVTNTIWASGGGTLAPSSDSDPTTVLFYDVTVTPDGSAVSRLPSNGTSYTDVFTVTNSGTLSSTFTLAATKAPGTTISITSVNGVAGTGGSVTLAAGANVSVPVVYTVANAALAGATDTLRLAATSTTAPSATDRGSWVVTVVRAGLTITKQLYRMDGTTLITSGSQVTPGDTVQFRVTVSGTGGAGASVVHVTDPIPSAVSYLSAVGDLAGWTIVQSGGTVTADLAGQLAAGQSRYFWIRVKVL